jgi:hypothetical protein
MNVTADARDDADVIERDVERTQDAMGDTVEKLEEKLSPSNLAQSLLSEDGRDTAREAWQVVRESPLPVAMIVGGAAWLLATSQAPMISRVRNQIKSRFGGGQSDSSPSSLRSRSEEPAPIGPPPEQGEAFDRRS